MGAVPAGPPAGYQGKCAVTSDSAFVQWRGLCRSYVLMTNARVTGTASICGKSTFRMNTGSLIYLAFVLPGARPHTRTSHSRNIIRMKAVWRPCGDRVQTIMCASCKTIRTDPLTCGDACETPSFA